jgi:polar amino acid transport system substrate-binding protein
MSDRIARCLGPLFRLPLVLVAFGASLAAPLDCGLAVERRPTAPLRVAVYDVPPYGTVGSDGALSGLSVDLWRRVAEDLEWEYRLTPVSQMETILSGLEQGRFDAAIGAITITPEREARIDFSYPTHRSGVAVAADLGTLIVGIFALLLLLGVVIWLIERPGRSGKPPPEDSVVTLRDGLYWAVVTMTTVGYGDKTPKTPLGRVVAVVWMLSSVALVSLLSASLVSRLTAERVENSSIRAESDLTGKKLAAVAQSSGAE